MTAPAGAQVEYMQGLVGNLLSGGVIGGGAANALLSKLAPAHEQAAKGNTTAAVGQLRAFINAVEALERSGQITAVEAAQLIAAATRLVDQLGG